MNNLNDCSAGCAYFHNRDMRTASYYFEPNSLIAPLAAILIGKLISSTIEDRNAGNV